MRGPPDDNWSPTLPPEDRARYRAAWESYRACRDCLYWDCDDGDTVGGCTRPSLDRAPAAFLTPEDYTCNEFAKK